VRALFWVLLLAAAAVAITLAARYNPGYVLLVLPAHRVELSLNFLIALILIGFAALYAVLRVLAHVLRLPTRCAGFASGAGSSAPPTRCTRRCAPISRAAMRRLKRPPPSRSS
jgi:uncharacterized protein HemY